MQMIILLDSVSNVPRVGEANILGQERALERQEKLGGWGMGGVVTSWTKMLGMGRDQVWMERQFWVWDLPYLWPFPTQGHIRDITDSLIKHCQDKRLDENANIQLSDEKIINVVIDLFGAGMNYPVIPFLWPAALTH